MVKQFKPLHIILTNVTILYATDQLLTDDGGIYGNCRKFPVQRLGLIRGLFSDKAELQRVTNLVRQVTERSGQGDTIHSIAAELGVSEQYVKDILICVQSFPEDNAEAVAHLMLD